MKYLDKTYNPKKTEGRIYDLWQKSGAFTPSLPSNLSSQSSDLKPFTIVIPPPNVTGSLHMGHALNNTIQDILIRRKRMQGVPALWLPGTDHAGIATQNVVEKNLAKDGKTRQELGPEKFTEEIYKWVNQYGHIIIDQLKSLGCSCDWSRQRYTMDADYKEAVNTAFKHYYDKGWIYQGERVVNWCIHCQTSLSDIEVGHVPQKAILYYFKYDRNFPITIATVRPETKLGDTAVAVNPNDARYKKYLGQTFDVNFCGIKRKIKIIADQAVDLKFATGALGVTPAHSLADAEIAEKNNLESITVIDKFGRINLKIQPTRLDLTGLKVAEAREKIIECLKKDGLLEKEEEIENNLSVCYRCKHPIEPQLSKQWFLKMAELAQPAIAAVESGEIKFVPERWKKVYLDWMKNIHDWCISRQIVWGHRLPVYINSHSEVSTEESVANATTRIHERSFTNVQDDIYVGNNPPEGYEQSSDVLDTWFSSALWPFATLGWPNQKTEDGKQKTDLDYFYPTTILTTARDLIYLWVARMIFSGYEFMDEKPFSTVYIHPTIFNIEGKRMSKSLGTGIDPLELIEKYGADAVRFGLTYINTGVQDIKFDEKAISAGQKFANKIWNIARFITMNISNSHSEHSEGSLANARNNSNKLRDSSLTLRMTPKTEADKKILARLSEIIESTDKNLDNFKFGQAAHNLYDFVWHDFADIYIETAKKQLEDDKIKENTQEILLYLLLNSLYLLHPMMPFVTEGIWQTLYQEKLVKEKLLINANWPE